MKLPSATALAAPKWLRIALAEEGEREIPGPADNPRIVRYLATTLRGQPQLLHDETPWCSAFVNWCFMKAMLVGTNKANARSWLEWGDQLSTPRLGCVAVFSSDARGPQAGHVGFYISETPQQIHVFGGNQHNRVCLDQRDRRTLLGYRWPLPLG